jgi:hypothetical protein
MYAVAKPTPPRARPARLLLLLRVPPVLVLQLRWEVPVQGELALQGAKGPALSRCRMPPPPPPPIPLLLLLLPLALLLLYRMMLVLVVLTTPRLMRRLVPAPMPLPLLL